MEISHDKINTCDEHAYIILCVNIHLLCTCLHVLHMYSITFIFLLHAFKYSIVVNIVSSHHCTDAYQKGPDHSLIALSPS